VIITEKVPCSPTWDLLETKLTFLRLKYWPQAAEGDGRVQSPPDQI
jgi:hypothetical protein